MQVHVAYQTSGCIAVHDHDALRHLDFTCQLSSESGRSSSDAVKNLQEMQRFVKRRKPGQVGRHVPFRVSALNFHRSMPAAHTRAISLIKRSLAGQPLWIPSNVCCLEHMHGLTWRGLCR